MQPLAFGLPQVPSHASVLQIQLPLIALTKAKATGVSKQAGNCQISASYLIVAIYSGHSILLVTNKLEVACHSRLLLQLLMPISKHFETPANCPGIRDTAVFPCQNPCLFNLRCARRWCHALCSG